MYLQNLQVRDTVKHSWSQFFDVVFMKVSVIYSSNTRPGKFRATRGYYSSIKLAGNTRQTT